MSHLTTQLHSPGSTISRTANPEEIVCAKCVGYGKIIVKKSSLKELTDRAKDTISEFTGQYVTCDCSVCDGEGVYAIPWSDL